MSSKPYATTIELDAYEIANLRWLFRKLWKDNGNVFNTGDWFGTVQNKLVDAAQRVQPYGPNSEEDTGSSPWDQG